MGNLSTFQIIFLSGLQEFKVYKDLYFLLTFVLYIIIILCNLTLIFTVTLDKSLHEPMYIFISNLCAHGLYGAVGFYPKFLLDLQSDLHTITYNGCLTQIYVIYSSGQSELALLTLMSYDRYVAICKPLQYHSILNPCAVWKLLVSAWLYPLFTTAVLVFLTARISTCGSHIHKLFCDNPSVLKLGCYQVIVNQAWDMVLVTVFIVQLVFILGSYTRIIQVCVASREGRRKFSKTCVPHIVVITLYTTTGLFDVLYGWDSSGNLPVGIRNALSVQPLILPPLLNPVIYGLQLHQIRKALCRHSCEHKIYCQR